MRDTSNQRSRAVLGRGLLHPGFGVVAALTILVAVLHGPPASSLPEMIGPGLSPLAGPYPAVESCLLEPVEIKSLACGSAILMEATTGTILYEKDADSGRAPASLVKMALQLVVFSDLAAGRVTLADSIETSANASTMGGSQVYLKHGERQTLGALLQAISISSANDAAMAVAEHLGGNEAAFVSRMNAAVRELGCTGTRFTNVHGLDLRRQDRNVTTARDIARIGRALIRYPIALELSSTRRAPFRGGEFWLDSTNLLLRRYEGLDGLKTGYTYRAGGCFCATAERDGVRFISVILKARPGTSRFALTRKLLDAGFAREPRRLSLVRAGQGLAILDPASASAVAGGGLWVLLEDSRQSSLDYRVRAGVDTTAGESTPIEAGDPLGFLDCRIDGRVFASIPAQAGPPPDRVPALAPAGPISLATR